MNAKTAIWLASAAMTIVMGLIGTFVTGWVQERNTDHEVLRELVFKDRYLHGADPIAPVKALDNK